MYITKEKKGIYWSISVRTGLNEKNNLSIGNISKPTTGEILD